ncbi:uncharacterized protein LOC106665500 [Cimex lectularius]|uniref:Uncharacterized protein n=1 Tax=Cimex lectularius TaxID=79782 RepID=A0A8I6RL89_CIMLE|nr:uncharacterized protein LOC106665500 [Cimex lectularius]
MSEEIMNLSVFDTLCIKKPTKLSNILESTPKPPFFIEADDVPPLLKSRRLDEKIPLIPIPLRYKTAYTRGHLGEPAVGQIDVSDMVIDDPYNYEMERKYEEVHDPALKDFFNKPENIKRLKDLKIINNEHEILCSLKDYNNFRRYLHRKNIPFVKDFINREVCDKKEKRRFSQFIRNSKVAYHSAKRADRVRTAKSEADAKKYQLSEMNPRCKSRLERMVVANVFHNKMMEYKQEELRRKGRLYKEKMKTYFQQYEQTTRRYKIDYYKKCKVLDEQVSKRIQTIKEKRQAARLRYNDKRWTARREQQIALIKQNAFHLKQYKRYFETMSLRRKWGFNEALFDLNELEDLSEEDIEVTESKEKLHAELKYSDEFKQALNGGKFHIVQLPESKYKASKALRKYIRQEETPLDRMLKKTVPRAVKEAVSLTFRRAVFLYAFKEFYQNMLESVEEAEASALKIRGKPDLRRVLIDEFAKFGPRSNIPMASIERSLCLRFDEEGKPVKYPCVQCCEKGGVCCIPAKRYKPKRRLASCFYYNCPLCEPELCLKKSKSKAEKKSKAAVDSKMSETVEKASEESTQVVPTQVTKVDENPEQDQSADSVVAHQKESAFEVQASTVQQQPMDDAVKPKVKEHSKKHRRKTKTVHSNEKLDSKQTSEASSKKVDKLHFKRISHKSEENMFKSDVQVTHEVESSHKITKKKKTSKKSSKASKKSSKASKKSKKSTKTVVKKGKKDGKRKTKTVKLLKMEQPNTFSQFSSNISISNIQVGHVLNNSPKKLEAPHLLKIENTQNQKSSRSFEKREDKLNFTLKILDDEDEETLDKSETTTKTKCKFKSTNKIDTTKKYKPEPKLNDDDDDDDSFYAKRTLYNYSKLSDLNKVMQYSPLLRSPKIPKYKESKETDDTQSYRFHCILPVVPSDESITLSNQPSKSLKLDKQKTSEVKQTPNSHNTKINKNKVVSKKQSKKNEIDASNISTEKHKKEKHALSNSEYYNSFFGDKTSNTDGESFFETDMEESEIFTTRSSRPASNCFNMGQGDCSSLNAENDQSEGMGNLVGKLRLKSLNFPLDKRRIWYIPTGDSAHYATLKGNVVKFFCINNNCNRCSQHFGSPIIDVPKPTYIPIKYETSNVCIRKLKKKYQHMHKIETSLSDDYTSKTACLYDLQGFPDVASAERGVQCSDGLLQKEAQLYTKGTTYNKHKTSTITLTRSSKPSKGNKPNKMQEHANVKFSQPVKNETSKGKIIQNDSDIKIKTTFKVRSDIAEKPSKVMPSSAAKAQSKPGTKTLKQESSAYESQSKGKASSKHQPPLTSGSKIPLKIKSVSPLNAQQSKHTDVRKMGDPKGTPTSIRKGGVTSVESMKGKKPEQIGSNQSLKKKTLDNVESGIQQINKNAKKLLSNNDPSRETLGKQTPTETVSKTTIKKGSKKDKNASKGKGKLKKKKKVEKNRISISPFESPVKELPPQVRRIIPKKKEIPKDMVMDEEESGLDEEKKVKEKKYYCPACDPEEESKRKRIILLSDGCSKEYLFRHDEEKKGLSKASIHKDSLYSSKPKSKKKDVRPSLPSFGSNILNSGKKLLKEREKATEKQNRDKKLTPANQQKISDEEESESTSSSSETSSSSSSDSDQEVRHTCKCNREVCRRLYKKYGKCIAPRQISDKKMIPSEFQEYSEISELTHKSKVSISSKAEQKDFITLMEKPQPWKATQNSITNPIMKGEKPTQRETNEVFKTSEKYKKMREGFLPVYFYDKDGRKYSVDSSGKTYHLTSEGHLLPENVELNIFAVKASGSKFFVDNEGHLYKRDNQGKEHLIGTGERYRVDYKGRKYFLDKDGKKFIVDVNGNVLLFDDDHQRYSLDASGKKMFLLPEGHKGNIRFDSKGNLIKPQINKANDDSLDDISKLIQSGKVYVDSEGQRAIVEKDEMLFYISSEGKKHILHPETNMYRVGSDGKIYLEDSDGLKYFSKYTGEGATKVDESLIKMLTSPVGSEERGVSFGPISAINDLGANDFVVKDLKSTIARPPTPGANFYEGKYGIKKIHRLADLTNNAASHPELDRIFVQKRKLFDCAHVVLKRVLAYALWKITKLEENDLLTLPIFLRNMQRPKMKAMEMVEGITKISLYYPMKYLTSKRLAPYVDILVRHILYTKNFDIFARPDRLTEPDLSVSGEEQPTEDTLDKYFKDLRNELVSRKYSYISYNENDPLDVTVEVEKDGTRKIHTHNVGTNIPNLPGYYSSGHTTNRAPLTASGPVKQIKPESMQDKTTDYDSKQDLTQPKQQSEEKIQEFPQHTPGPPISLDCIPTLTSSQTPSEMARILTQLRNQALEMRRLRQMKKPPNKNLLRKPRMKFVRSKSRKGRFRQTSKGRQKLKNRKKKQYKKKQKLTSKKQIKKTFIYSFGRLEDIYSDISLCDDITVTETDKSASYTHHSKSVNSKREIIEAPQSTDNAVAQQQQESSTAASNLKVINASKSSVPSRSHTEMGQQNKFELESKSKPTKRSFYAQPKDFIIEKQMSTTGQSNQLATEKSDDFILQTSSQLECYCVKEFQKEKSVDSHRSSKIEKRNSTKLKETTKFKPKAKDIPEDKNLSSSDEEEEEEEDDDNDENDDSEDSSEDESSDDEDDEDDDDDDSDEEEEEDDEEVEEEEMRKSKKKKGKKQKIKLKEENANDEVASFKSKKKYSTVEKISAKSPAKEIRGAEKEKSDGKQIDIPVFSIDDVKQVNWELYIPGFKRKTHMLFLLKLFQTKLGNCINFPDCECTCDVSVPEFMNRLDPNVLLGILINSKREKPKPKKRWGFQIDDIAINSQLKPEARIEKLEEILKNKLGTYTVEKQRKSQELSDEKLPDILENQISLLNVNTSPELQKQNFGPCVCPNSCLLEETLVKVQEELLNNIKIAREIKAMPNKGLGAKYRRRFIQLDPKTLKMFKGGKVCLAAREQEEKEEKERKERLLREREEEEARHLAEALVPKASAEALTEKEKVRFGDNVEFEYSRKVVSEITSTVETTNTDTSVKKKTKKSTSSKSKTSTSTKTTTKTSKKKKTKTKTVTRSKSKKGKGRKK